MSQKLSSVSKMDLKDSDINLLSKSTCLSGKSWFTSKMMSSIQPKIFPKDYSQALQSSLQKIMDLEVEKKKEEMKPKKQQLKKNGEPKKPKGPPAENCKKIKLYPTPKEKEILNKWMGTARWTYNQCLYAIKTNGIEKTEKDLRAYCTNGNSKIVQENKWVLDTPYEIRDQAMKDLLKAYNTCFSVGNKFQMKYKKKKERKESIVIRKKTLQI
jgi:hypothetical protein